MKANKIYILLLGLCMIIATTGCEDRLNIEKHGNLGSQEDFYKTDADAESAVAALYISWRVQYKNFYYLVNSLSDDTWTAGGGRGDNRNLEQLNEYNYDSNNITINECYTEMYKLIYNANLIIDQVEPDSDIKKRTIAEAKFFRGYAYFQLVTVFGPVSKVDHLLANSEYRQGNCPVEELWDFVEQDLQDAINANILPSKAGPDDQETGMRVTVELAKTFLGKAYLFQKKYAEAGRILDEVIESGKYGLYEGEYGDLLHASTNNCRESMFEVQMRKDADQAWNQMVDMFCAMGWRAEAFEYTNDEIAPGTWGFLSPRKALYDAFVEMEGEDGYRLKSSIRTRIQLEEFGAKMKKTTLPGNEGVFSWKFRPLKSDCVYDNPGYQVLQYINLSVMRYAEVLLLAAEAHVMAGSDQAKADRYLNEVRNRARLEQKSGVTLDDIKKEKRLELCMESCRYQDLVRWGDAETVLREQGGTIPSFTLSDEGESVNTNAYQNSEYGFKEKHKLLPIPAIEIQLNENMQQNQGWD